MASTKVSLNSKEYAIVPFENGNAVQRNSIDAFSPVQRSSAETPASQIEHYRTVRFPNFSLGHGRARICADSAFKGDEYRKFWDSNGCITWHPAATRLPILEEDTTAASLTLLRASTSFKGNLWSVWSSGASAVVARKFVGSSTTWTAGGTVVDGLTFDAELSSSAAQTHGTYDLRAFTTSGANRVLVVMVGFRDPTDGATITQVTYNSVDMTKRAEETSVGDKAYISLWTLDDPASGSNGIAVHSSEGINYGYSMQAVSFKGSSGYVADSAVSATGTSTAPTDTVTTTSGDHVVAHAIQQDPSAALTPAQTDLGTGTSNISAGEGIAFSGQRKQSLGTSQVMSWSSDTSDPWGVVAAAVGGTSSSPVDLISHKTRMIALSANEDDHIVHHSTDGVTWTVATTPITAGLLVNDTTAHEDIDAGLLASGETELYAAVWDEDGGTITFFSSTNIGTAWTDETLDLASGNGPQGIATYPDIDGVDKLYVGTREGLYLVDTSLSTWTATLVYAMPSHSDNCRRMVVHQGALWFGQGVNNDSPAPVIKMTVQGDAGIFDTRMGLDQGDSLTVDALGPIRRMKSAGKYLFASMGGGAASRKGRVMVHYVEGWHTVRQNGTANQKIEWVDVAPDDDGTQRLLYAVRTDANTHDVNFLANPTTNPESGIGIKYEASGFIDLPYMAAGLPHHKKTWARNSVNAIDISASTSGEYINVDYGVDDGSGGLQARNNTDLGNILSGTNQLEFGSGAGIGSVNLGARINLHRDGGSTAHTPVLHDVDFSFQPAIPHLDRYTFLVDLNATAQARGQNVRDVISDLETCLDLATLPAFKYAGVSTNVRVESVQSLDELGNNPGVDSSARREGLVQVTCAEVM